MLMMAPETKKVISREKRKAYLRVAVTPENGGVSGEREGEKGEREGEKGERGEGEVREGEGEGE